MKGNEKLIGLIVGIILTALATALGLQSDELKAGLCGVSPAPAATVSPAPVQ